MKRSWAGAATILLLQPSVAVGGWQVYDVPTPPTQVPSYPVWECAPLYVDRAGNVWVAFSVIYGGGGIYIFNGTTWSPLPRGGPVTAFPLPNYETKGSITEDQSGNIWINSSRWDGIEWKTFTAADGIGDESVNGVLADRDGGVWFGTSGYPVGVVSRFDGTSWSTFSVPQTSYTAPARPLYQDTEGGIWFAVYGKVARLYHGNWTTYDLPDGVDTIFQDQNGTVVVASSGVFRRVVGGQLVIVPHGSVPIEAYGSGTNNVVRDATGTLWKLGYEYSSEPASNYFRLYRYNGRAWRPLTREDGHPDLNQVFGAYVYGLVADPVGGLWIGSRGRILHFDGERVRQFPGYGFDPSGSGDLCGFGLDGVTLDGVNGPVHYTTSDGLVSNNVTGWLRARDGTDWFGTDSGVSRFDGSAWASYPNSGNLPGGVTQFIVQDTLGGVWDFTPSGAARFDAGSWQLYGAVDGLIDGTRRQVITGSQGSVWVATDSGTDRWVSRFDGGTWTTFDPGDGVPSIAGRLFEDGHGNGWAFGRSVSPPAISGLSRFDGDSWKPFTAADGIPVDSVETVWPDGNGAVWAFLIAGGLARYDGVGWTRYDGSNGGTEYRIELAQDDRFGGVWFQTTDTSGPLLLRFDEGLWTRYTYSSISSCGFRKIIPQPAGADLWVELWCGVARFDGTDFTQFTGFPTGGNFSTLLNDRFGGAWYSDEESIVRFAADETLRRYGATQGLEQNVDILSQSNDGGILFATLHGLQRYHPDRVAPFVQLISGPGRNSGTSDLSITFTAPFDAASAIEYSYRFDGSGWSPWSAGTTWSQRGTPDGPHVFEVRARDYAGNISPYPAVSRFAVDAAPPAPILASPTFGQPVRGTVDIRGTAADPRFQAYRLEHRPSGAASWTGATLLLESTTPVLNAGLGSWDTASLPDGAYDLRLSVTDSLGLTGSVIATVVVDNHAPYFDVTAPTTVAAATGGDVFTTNAETHLYFPPHAFTQDAVVMVTAAGSAPSTLPSDAAKVLDGYEIVWAGALQKPARLTLSYAGVTPPRGTLALYRSPDGTNWERLGGTVDAAAKSISLAVSLPGRYALFVDNGLGMGAASLSGIAFTPRVFSPSGSFADRQVGISFRLGRPAPVTVKVFSRSGRLIREVASGLALNAGDNLIRWDGTDRNGGYVLDGTYLVTVEALGHTETKTLAVVK